ncbi:MAG: ImmA/IrrE family metallo-endopeptidase [Planctomycetota bacterium]
MPDFDLGDDPTAIDFQSIEQIAQDTRRAFGIGDGPIPDLVLLLENHGVVVARQDLLAATLDAFSNWTGNGVPFIVLGSEKGSEKPSAVRSRFDAAHELAHCVLHRRVPPRRLRDKATNKLLEDQAHYFAGAFLLPASTFKPDVFVPTLNAFVPLKSKWKASIGAMIKRCAHLGIISEYQERRLFQNRARRGWSTWEPLDDELPLESPRLIERSFALLQENGLADRAEVESALGLFVEDVESVTGLPEGFFGDTVQNFRFPSLAL